MRISPDLRNLEMLKVIRNSFLFAALAGLASVSSAQWTGVLIHPGGDYSYANGASTGIAVGGSGAPSAAGYWTNSGATYTSLYNPSLTLARLNAGDLNMQVGYSTSPSLGHACRWFGTAASYEDMNPDRFSFSEARTMHGNKMGGYGYYAGGDVAPKPLLWNGGDRNDFTDLLPADADQGSVYAMDATTQVGASNLIGDVNSRAGMWSGTAASWKSLAPVGSVRSWAFATAGGRQGGQVLMPEDYGHAYLWSGTAESGIDLNPVGNISSVVNGMSANYQVGRTLATNEGPYNSRAAIWSGSSNSWVDLHSFLPASSITSEATSVVEYADHIEVYGFIKNGGMATDPIAVMWTQPVPEPGSVLAVVIGLAGLARLRRKSK